MREDWENFSSISVAMHHALVLYQTMERVAAVRGETLVRPEVVCISEFRLIERHAKGIIAGVDHLEARALLTSSIFRDSNDSETLSLDQLMTREPNSDFGVLTRDQFEGIVNDVFVMTQAMSR